MDGDMEVNHVQLSNWSVKQKKKTEKSNMAQRSQFQATSHRWFY